MGMLAAVEMWVKRDHKAEWTQWEGWLGPIADSREEHRWRHARNCVSQARISPTERRRCKSRGTARSSASPGRKSPSYLLDTDPRIVLANSQWSSRRQYGEFGVGRSLPDELRAMRRWSPIVCTRCSPNRRSSTRPAQPEGQPTAIAGQWEVHLEFVRGSVNHSWSSNRMAGN